MIQDLVESQRWPAKRWWALIGLVFTTQLGLILWLGRPQRVRPLPNDRAPTLQLAGQGAAEVLALSDPTLFALPHREGFSGAAWLTIHAQEFRPFAWSEPPFSLAPIQTQLGADFEKFMSTNQPDGLPVVAQPELKFKVPVVVQSEPFPTESTLLLTGGLAGRHLLASPALPSWPSAEILTNSVVHMLVAADGESNLATLLRPTSGSIEADQYALREARKARFEPLMVNDPANPLEGLTGGQLVFQWHTLPLSITNQAVEPAPGK
jgi:hypothetical protein